MPDWILNKDPEPITEAQINAMIKLSAYVKTIAPEELQTIITLIGYDVWVNSLTKGAACGYITDALEYSAAKKAEKERIKRETKALEKVYTCMVCKNKFKSSIREYKKTCPRCNTSYFEV